MIFDLIEFSKEYLPNEYLRALIIFLLSFIIFQIIFTLTKRLLILITLKTKTDIDDLIIKRSAIPIFVLSVFISIHLSLTQINFAESIQITANKIVYTLSLLITGYLIYIIIDLVLLKFLERITKNSQININKTFLYLLQSIISLLVIILIFLYIMNVWGVEIGPLLAAAGIAGIAVALALQPTLGNIFSGISIVLDKTIRIGDLVYLDPQTKGKIENIGIRSTKLRTFDNELIIIPNSKLADSMIQNVALPEPKSRVVISFGVSYGTDINKVKSIVLNEIKKIANVEKEPEPLVRFIEMGSSSLNFKAYFYVDSFENKFNAIDEANTRIYNVLRKNKIEIPFPQMDIYLRKYKK